MFLSRRLKGSSIPRATDASDRLVVVALAARFMDELLSGLPTVLMPTIRATFGLSYAQVSLLGLILNYVAAVVEPAAGLLIDVWRRPWLMAWGAAGIGLGTAVMGLAPTLAVLMAGFAIFGLASGPLAHTGDVVLVESYPEAPERVFARGTLIDSVGALLAPLLVSVTLWLGLEWRWLMVGLGATGFLYAIVILRTRFPTRAGPDHREAVGFGRAIRENLRSVFSNRPALSWLIFLLILDFVEAPMTFNAIWLREQVGMSQALVGVYIALQMGVGIVSLAYLDRWLMRSSYRQILITAGVGMLVLYPVWLLTPGIAARFVLSVPLSFLFTVFWPIGKGQSLASVPGRAGTVSALHSLVGLFPVPLLFGLLAEAISLTPAMLWVELGAITVMLLVVVLLPARPAEGTINSKPTPARTGDQ